jgi:hypothetical protein
MLRRRVEMLDAVSTGLHPSVVVSQLASKYGISERALWSDWERRRGWVPFVLGLGKFAGFAEEVGQKLDAVQRAAWSLYLKASNDSARVGALRTVLEALGLHSELVQMKEVAERLEKLEETVKRQNRARRFG